MFLITILISLVLLFCLRCAGSADEPSTIGVIQYNVKGGFGGWKRANSVLDAQVKLIIDQIRSAPVDFIALEQADDDASIPEPIISDELAGNESRDWKLRDWKTIVSACYPDTTQLAFSSSWELVGAPLVNGISPPRGWTRCDRIPHNDGRPYNIAFFKSKKSALKVLFVVTHMPHCWDESKLDECVKGWNLSQFDEDVAKVLGAADRQFTNLIMAGDLNELGAHLSVITKQIFPKFRNVQISSAVKSCCNNSEWGHTYDRILANSSNISMPTILGGDNAYPHKGVREEHKAIYGTVVFSSVISGSK
jgi:hypothetical protein